MTRSFKPVFTITNRMTAGLTRIEWVIRRDALTKRHGLADRQARAVGQILEHGDLTIQDSERQCPDTKRRSLQRDLKAMPDMMLLVAEGSTNKLAYRMKETG